MFDRLIAQHVVLWRGEAVELTAKGRQFFLDRGIDIPGLEGKKRPLCRTCVDWSERRNHLGGGIGAAILTHVSMQGWATREAGSRTVGFNAKGEKRFATWYSE